MLWWLIGLWLCPPGFSRSFGSSADCSRPWQSHPARRRPQNARSSYCRATEVKTPILAKYCFGAARTRPVGPPLTWGSGLDFGWSRRLAAGRLVGSARLRSRR
jgi:hypothetical protein